MPSLAMSGTLAAGEALSQAIDTPAAARSAAQWQRTAIDDIEAAYRLTLENHPCTYDTANPGLRNNLAVAREQGLALAAKVTNGAPSVPGFATGRWKNQPATNSIFSATGDDGGAGRIAPRVCGVALHAPG
ncbi:hypothetical protein F2P44_21680 [Massilia sp. CCM 8695]|uniref:Uncharacterized protein n=1 Tax=Massilia frigida TaxID=2609281 RepID=A0ABX0NF37_9BURK|nr:hypothetical protein [Massilia frigida]NHZ81866.1 hypothetical protein [Massilia frigida]